MKLLIVLLFSLVSYCFCTDTKFVIDEWLKFQEKYNKTYNSFLEARFAFFNFKTNILLIEAHNSLYDAGDSSYSLKMNEFGDLSESQFMDYWFLIFKDTNAKRNIFKRTEGLDLPRAVDWRKKGIVTDVKQRGSCGWAYSAVGALEGQYALKTGKLVSFSEQNLMDCSRRGSENEGCKGGDMDLSFEYVKNYGIESEDDYPFGDLNGKCRFNQSKAVTKISSFVDVERGMEHAVQEAIATIGPIAVAIDASGTGLQFYSSGIFDNYCSKASVNHAVLAVGYDSENGKDYYILKNSWGVNWGESGYFKIPRSTGFRCGISHMASYPQL